MLFLDDEKTMQTTVIFISRISKEKKGCYLSASISHICLCKQIVFLQDEIRIWDVYSKSDTLNVVAAITS